MQLRNVNLRTLLALPVDGLKDVSECNLKTFVCAAEVLTRKIAWKMLHYRVCDFGANEFSRRRNCSRQHKKFSGETVHRNQNPQNMSLVESRNRNHLAIFFSLIQSTLRSSWPDLKIPVFCRHYKNLSSVFCSVLTITGKVKFQLNAFKYRGFAYPSAKCFVDF